MTACLICHHDPGAPPRTVCPGCETRLRALLREIDAQRPLLAASLRLDTAPADGRPGGGRAHSPLPVRGDVLTLLGAGTLATVTGHPGDQSGPVPLDTLLAGWAHAIATEITGREDVRAFRRRGSTWSAWLTAYLPHIVTSPGAGALHDELTDVVYRIRAITRTEPRRHSQTAPCPHCEAFALVATDWQPDIHCEACGLLLTPSQYDDHARATLPRLVRLGILMAAAPYLGTETQGAAA
ncbi:hypothetical protein ACFUJR_27820 [Streptomyces sp. NPDC057271]|uniref:hypothetical protein n=1 Tax=unclassified Streptomyces TaxID=2593676 RepID=UPI0036310954